MVEYIYGFKDESKVLFFDNDKNRHIFLDKGNLVFAPTFAPALRIEKIIYKHLNITYKQWKAKIK